MANQDNPGAFRPDDIQHGGVVGQSGDPTGASGGGTGAGGGPLPGTNRGPDDVTGGMESGAEREDELENPAGEQGDAEG